MAAVPDRLEEAVGEAQREDVLRGLLAEEVVDPEDRVLVEELVEGAVERRALDARSAPNGFSITSRVRPSTGSPPDPSISTIGSIAEGGTAR